VEAVLLARSQTAERALLDAYRRAAQGPDRAVAVLGGRNRLLSPAAERLLSPQALAALERRAVVVRRQDTPVDRVRLPEDAGCTARVTPYGMGVP
jgi:hypothetical protein